MPKAMARMPPGALAKSRKRALAPVRPPVAMEVIERRIHLFRGQRVMVDSDLASLYEVATGHMNRAVKRNPERFPKDFMFQLTLREAESLICQIGISKTGRGGRRSRPYVFTQEGVAMLSSVLQSQRATMVNVAIMRAFVTLREAMLTHKDLASKIEALERKHKEHDSDIKAIFDAVKQLFAAPVKPKRAIGFASGQR
jgi:ORF6N domain